MPDKRSKGRAVTPLNKERYFTVHIKMEATNEKFTFKKMYADMKITDLRSDCEFIIGLPKHVQRLRYLDKGDLMDESTAKANDIVGGATLDMGLWQTWGQLIEAVVANDIDWVFQLGVTQDSDYNTPNSNYMYPNARKQWLADRAFLALYIAAHRGHTKLVEKLIASGVDVNQSTPLGRTALHVAAGAGHGTIVDSLLENGADIDAEDADGNNALAIASRFGNKACERHLFLFRWQQRAKSTKAQWIYSNTDITDFAQVESLDKINSSYKQRFLMELHELFGENSGRVLAAIQEETKGRSVSTPITRPESHQQDSDMDEIDWSLSHSASFPRANRPPSADKSTKKELEKKQAFEKWLARKEAQDRIRQAHEREDKRRKKLEQEEKDSQIDEIYSVKDTTSVDAHFTGSSKHNLTSKDPNFRKVLPSITDSTTGQRPPAPCNTPSDPTLLQLRNEAHSHSAKRTCKTIDRATQTLPWEPALPRVKELKESQSKSQVPSSRPKSLERDSAKNKSSVSQSPRNYEVNEKTLPIKSALSKSVSKEFELVPMSAKSRKPESIPMSIKRKALLDSVAKSQSAKAPERNSRQRVMSRDRSTSRSKNGELPQKPKSKSKPTSSIVKYNTKFNESGENNSRDLSISPKFVATSKVNSMICGQTTRTPCFGPSYHSSLRQSPVKGLFFIPNPSEGDFYRASIGRSPVLARSNTIILPKLSNTSTNQNLLRLLRTPSLEHAISPHYPHATEPNSRSLSHHSPHKSRPNSRAGTSSGIFRKKAATLKAELEDKSYDSWLAEREAATRKANKQNRMHAQTAGKTTEDIVNTVLERRKEEARKGGHTEATGIPSDLWKHVRDPTKYAEIQYRGLMLLHNYENQTQLQEKLAQQQQHAQNQQQRANSGGIVKTGGLR